jgi:putative membrane protein
MEEKEDPPIDDPRIYLAAERTELALERTHLAWIRTVIGMIVSGFALDNLMEIIHSARLEAGTAWFRHAHLTGIILTMLGTLVMAFETIYFVKRSKQLYRMRGATHWRVPSGLIVSILVFLLGVLLVYFILAGDGTPILQH